MRGQDDASRLYGWVNLGLDATDQEIQEALEDLHFRLVRARDELSQESRSRGEEGSRSD